MKIKDQNSQCRALKKN